MENYPKTSELIFSNENEYTEPPHPSIENSGYVPLTVERGEITRLLKEWGFSNEEINTFEIVFRPVSVSDSKIDEGYNGGFYTKKDDHGYIEVYTTDLYENQNGQLIGTPLSENDINYTLLHELRHALQDRLGKLDGYQSYSNIAEANNNPHEVDADSWVVENQDKYSLIHVSVSSDAEKDNSETTRKGRLENKGFIISENETPPHAWGREVDEFILLLDNTSIEDEELAKKYKELSDRGNNMADAGSIGLYEYRSKMDEIKQAVERTEVK